MRNTKTQFVLDFERPIRELENQLTLLKEKSHEHNLDLRSEVSAIEKKIEQTRRDVYTNLNAWQKVQLARHPLRPYSLDYIERLFDDFQELHGDRRFRDDQALIGGTAFFEGQGVMILAQQKGRDTRENIKRSFGMPHPEGYRKALRLVEMANRFNLPVISFVDTKAAYAGRGSEERHVAEAIAVNLREMSRAKVPIIAIVIGEGGSGGALGIAVADRVIMLQYAYYSVIPPEGCAAILWRDRKFAPEASEALKLGAGELLELKVVDEIIREPLGGAHNDPETTTENIRQSIRQNLKKLQSLKIDKLLQQRYEKFRAMGQFVEA